MIDKAKMTLHVHILTAEGSKQDLIDFANENNMQQYSLRWDENRWTMSAPIPMEHRGRFAWLYHKTKGLQQ